MILQHRDGALRILSGGAHKSTGVTNIIKYHEVLFVNAGFNAPIGRSRPTETIVMDRGVYDANAEYRKGMDSEKLEPLTLSWTFKLSDTTRTRVLVDLLRVSGGSGGTGTTASNTTVACRVNGTWFRSTKGESKIDGVSTPLFADPVKIAWDVQVLWDGTSDFGYKWREVYFPPSEQNISEGEEEVTISLSGLVYGDVTRITAFSSGARVSPWY